jgi:hypothetical protein
MVDNLIYTLNARDNILPELLREEFKLTPAHMMREIQAWCAELVPILKAKGIEYGSCISIYAMETA